MGKRLTPIDQFYIDNHKGESAEKLAKLIGCTSRTVYNYLAKSKGEARTEEGREAIKEGAPTPEPTTSSLTPEQQKSLPPIGTKLTHSSRTAVAFTKEAAEVGDEINKMGGKTIIPSYMHVMNPDKG